MVANLAALPLLNFVERNRLPLRLVARVAGISDGVIRNFRNDPNRSIGLETKIKIGRALHLLTGAQIDLSLLFGDQSLLAHAAIVNNDKNCPFSNALKMRGITPEHLARLAGVDVIDVVSIIDGDSVAGDVAGKISSVLGVDILDPSEIDRANAEVHHNSLLEYSIFVQKKDLSNFSHYSSAQLKEYVNHIIRGDEHIYNRIFDGIDGLRSKVLDCPGDLGENWTIARLYRLTSLRDLLVEEVRKITTPPLARIVRIELVHLAQGVHGRKISHPRHRIDAFDGFIYVRSLSVEERYLEIGNLCKSDAVPESEYGLWLGVVLDELESCSDMFNKMVITNAHHIGAHALYVLLDRGWRQTEVGRLEFASPD